VRGLHVGVAWWSQNKNFTESHVPIGRNVGVEKRGVFLILFVGLGNFEIVVMPEKWII
jgi:hypothetical protein